MSGGTAGMHAEPEDDEEMSDRAPAIAETTIRSCAPRARHEGE